VSDSLQNAGGTELSNKTVISPGQMLSLMILFEFGTAIVIYVGLKAQQGAWLSILVALPGGILLYLLYHYLFRQYPDMIVSAYMRKLLGVYLAWPLSLFIVAFFVYNAARNLREAGDLLVTSIYDETPLFVIHAAMIAAMIYVLQKGIEVFFRLAQFYIFVILAVGIISYTSVLFSGDLHFKNILPISGEGWGAVFQAAYPSILLFPFGEIFCFTTVLPHLSDKRLAGRTGVIAILFSGVALALTHAIELLILGKSIYIRSTFSLLTAISMVDIANFLQRLDALAMLTLIICVFFKMSMYGYAAMAIMADLLGLTENRKLAYPVGIVILFMSIFSAWSFPEHTQEGKASMFMLFLITIAIPILLFVVHQIKKRLRSH
jgi:spore germination protein KB